MSKRTGIFDQGRPEQPYNDRDEPADVPKKATAAQLAARKIKSVKPVRRPAASSAHSMSSSAAFNFGAPSAFGGGATNSFPPAQSSAPSNTFTNSSFPAFGGSTQSAGFNFNPQPPSTDFNFTAGSGNPFATPASAPAMNGATPAFGGFGTQSSTTNPFGGFGQNTTTGPASGGLFGTTSSAPQNNLFGVSAPAPASQPFTFGASTSSAPQTNMFGATISAAPAATGTPITTSQPFTFGASTSSAPQINMFGNTTSAAPTATSTPATTSQPFTFGASTSSAPQTNLFGAITSAAPIATSTPASTSQPFTFGATSSAAPNNASTSGTGFVFGGAGASTPPTAPAQAQNSFFSGFGANAQTSEPSTETATPQTKPLAGFGSGAQGMENFGTTQANHTAATPASTTNLFGVSTSVAPSTNNATSAPSSNPFSNLASAKSTTPSLFPSLTPTTQTSQAQENASPSSNSLFSNFKPTSQNTGAAAETPKFNPFTSLERPTSTPATTSAASNSNTGIFGALQNKTAATTGTEKTSGTATLKALEAPKSSLFNGFSTPQPAKTSNPGKLSGGLFSSTQSKPSSGIFSQTFESEGPKSGDLFNPLPKFSSTGPSSSSQEVNDASTPQAPPKAASSLFTKPSTSSAVPTPPTSAMPTLTGGAAPSIETAKAPELPKIPKVHVPKEWAVPNAAAIGSVDASYNNIVTLTAQLQGLNMRYREQVGNLPLTADWSSLSLWHYQHATNIKKHIDVAKKQRAAARGITGNESSLSTKRKVNDESPDYRNTSPTKRACVQEAPATPTPQPLGHAPKLDPPATSTSNLFAKAIGDKPPTPSASTNLFAPQPVEKSNAESLKPSASASGFKPSTPASASGFKPSASASNGTTSAPGGFKPNFGGQSSSGGGFFSQFAKTAKTYEELAAERKAKAMEEDYDSDDETKEEWSARYDKEEADRLAKEKEEVATAPKFSAPNSTKSSGSTSPVSNPFGGLPKATGGASTAGLFSSRVGSPALSTGGQSVFDAPSNANTPSSNIFAHLSSGPSSNNQDESDEDDREQESTKLQNDQPILSVEPTTPPKRKFGDSETESDETLEETMKRKKQETNSKGSLLSRMTRDDFDSAESEKENLKSSSLFGKTNGTQTPTNKPFQFFDFSAAGSGTTTPKSDLFAGDQTFKPGTPIKFGGAPATETKSAAPKFVFQPATPSAADFSTTPAKPPPSTLFNFGASASGSSLLAPNAGFSGAPSVTSSVFSSRAGTPLSEADNSAASAAEDDEDGGKQEQVDFSQLTEEETSSNDIVFHAEVVLAKHQVDRGDGTKAWTNLAKGPLWILKDKVTGKSFIRIRIASGATPLDYRLLPALQATVTGGSKKMVMATKPAKEGGLQQVLYAVKTTEIAEEFASKYNDSLPSK